MAEVLAIQKEIRYILDLLFVSRTGDFIKEKIFNCVVNPLDFPRQTNFAKFVLPNPM
jgi:hypothetical protein